MQIQTPVIQIDRTDHSDLIITHKRLRMQKSRLILINLYPGFQQLLIIRLCQKKHQLLIWNPRRHNPHIHATLGSQTQRCHHLIINDQIRRTDINIILCFIYDIQINILTDDLFIQRSITKRLNKSITFKFLSMISVRKISLIINTFI